MKIILSGFDPFGGESTNPSWEAVKEVETRDIGAEVIKLEIPTSFNRALPALRVAMEEHRPEVVLCIGQAGGRAALTPERVAINLDDARIPDNDGLQPEEDRIIPEGENAYFSNLPLKSMVEAIREAGLPAQISNTAGTFVCNHLLYGLMHLIETEFPKCRGGFMHVPYAPEQVAQKPGQPSMSVSDIARGIRAALSVVIAGEPEAGVD